MPTTATLSFLPNKLDPVQDEDLARTEDINLAVGSYNPGQLLGEIAATPGVYGPYSPPTASPATAPTINAHTNASNPGAGNWTVAYSYVTAAGETAISPATTQNIPAGSAPQIAALTGLPAAVTAVNVYMNPTVGATGPLLYATQLTVTANATAATDITAAPAASAKVAPTGNSAATASNGTGTARLINMYGCTVTAPTDGSGINDVSYGSEFGRTIKSTPAYYKGTFRTQDLASLDAAALAAMAGRLIEGTISNGKIVF